ncbi:hypothetical protein MSAN_00573800 [Mycena sanguinolenta]|uniref:Protein kinase domain-containing protein n=1 Tax=Mycena sanguinolenta TaxID=230812 RepID=A0A8H6Z9W1_9AGAR|nr:hypothetical protein MSAN_00573800 [Mycena sanguinolenta]
MPGRGLMRTVRVRLGLSRNPKAPPDPEKAHRRLAILVDSLTFAEKAAEATPVPCLKGAIGFALEVVKCVQGYRSNNEEMNRLAQTCAILILNIDRQVKLSRGMPPNIEPLVEDLCRTLERVQSAAKDIGRAGSQVHRFLVYRDYSEKLAMLSKEVADAQLAFLTLGFIANISTQTQDTVYDHHSIVLGSCYASGDGWIAYTGNLQETGENVLVKSYRDPSKKAMLEVEIKAFKKNWHSNLLQFIGRSVQGADDPYIVLRGVTSDHVSNYIATKFAEDNQRGSVEALRLLRDLTNALAFIVGTTDSSSFDISKVHLNDSGNIVVVNLDPILVVNKGSHDDMPYWQSWQIICIELLAGDPSYEPDPSIEYNTDPASHRRLEYLRPVLGHIHYGATRFKETSIEKAFKRESLVLSQALRELVARVHNPLTSSEPDTQVLRVMWRRELHYVAHFREPLDLDIGDIGYITGDPPRFVRLANNHFAVSRRTDGQRQLSRELHEFRFPNLGDVDLADWRKGRPRLQKDFLLRRINLPREPGLVVDCSGAWKVLAERADDLAANHSERSISASNLILIVYFKQQSGYAVFRSNRKIDSSDQWQDIWAKEGLDSPPEAIYFYECPPGGPTGVWGVFLFVRRAWQPICQVDSRSRRSGRDMGLDFLVRGLDGRDFQAQHKAIYQICATLGNKLLALLGLSCEEDPRLQS